MPWFCVELGMCAVKELALLASPGLTVSTCAGQQLIGLKFAVSIRLKVQARSCGCGLAQEPGGRAGEHVLGAV